ncbi:STAS domain-containing protein [Nonomuraea fastidiosa]|jgi:anti-anti-sigma factor|uniref:STAS domain-containing protein n=1 Tax=Nonomuraea TaxID=83681 RepID=UPI003244588F
MSSPLSYTRRDLPGGLLIAVRGELDSTNERGLESYVHEHLRPGDDLILDVGGVTFIDSHGLYLLLRLDAAVRDQGGALRLAAVQAAPARVLRISGVGQALDIRPDVQAAVQGMRGEHANGPAARADRRST